MNIKEKIREFLEKETQGKIGDYGADLIVGGFLDSFTMIKLITFIETELDIKIDMEELSPDNFNSVNAIVSMIEK